MMPRSQGFSPNARTRAVCRRGGVAAFATGAGAFGGTDDTHRSGGACRRFTGRFGVRRRRRVGHHDLGRSSLHAASRPWDARRRDRHWPRPSAAPAAEPASASVTAVAILRRTRLRRIRGRLCADLPGQTLAALLRRLRLRLQPRPYRRRSRSRAKQITCAGDGRCAADAIKAFSRLRFGRARGIGTDAATFTGRARPPERARPVGGFTPRPRTLSRCSSSSSSLPPPLNMRAMNVRLRACAARIDAGIARSRNRGVRRARAASRTSASARA